MITIIYSTHKDVEYNLKFKEHLIKSVGVKDVQILEYVNHNQYSLAEIYNKGISESINDIVVCCHNDIHLEKNWGKKLLEDFSDNPEFGIIGKAGSCYFPKSGVYWEKMQETMVGQVYHQPKGQKKWLSKYSPKLPFLVSVVTIDGLFMAFNKTKIKHKFDETIGKFHFYDHSFCVPNFLDGVKIGVTSSFEITHESVGQPNLEFFESKFKFLDKWENKLPLDLKPEKIYIPQIKEKPIKNIGKVAVIILTKGKIDLLENCIKSLYEHCNKNLFDIFIADTGSNYIEKEYVDSNILPMGNIKYIEYDYYNFAKINNDVVKNHIGDEYEFLLFCNNDIVILNNVIYGMLNTFKTIKNVGTVGCRLHYENNTIQHDGILPFFNKNEMLILSHIRVKNYYNHSITLSEVVGSTAALLMIRKKVFESCGLFNEKYQSHLEDFELNAKCVVLGYKNYCNGLLVAYHLESQTRKDDPDKREKQDSDYVKNLIPFMMENLRPLKKYIIKK